MCHKNKYSLNEVEKQFVQKFLKRGGILLLSKADAILMVQECLNKKFRILGIDGFWISDEATEPSLENSVDFSSTKLQASYLDPAFKDPITFLQTRDEKMMFEIVCDDSLTP
jgi:hypothetical protein